MTNPAMVPPTGITGPCEALLCCRRAHLARSAPRSCPSGVRINTTGLRGNHLSGKKAQPIEPLCHHGKPMHPVWVLKEGVRTHVASAPACRRALSCSVTYTAAGWGHGGTRNCSTSRKLQTWSVSPATIACVPGGQHWAEPVPLVGSGWSKGLRKETCGKQKL